MNQAAGRGPLGLQLIGAFKFVSGLLLVALGIHVFRGAGGQPGEQFARLVAALKLDPENHYIHSAIEKVSGIGKNQLRAIGAGTFFYALIYLVEGVGLLLRRRWAEYFTILATGLFIPVELYEVARDPRKPIRVGVLVLNVAIVAYLAYQVRRKGDGGAGASGPAPPTVT